MRTTCRHIQQLVALLWLTSSSLLIAAPPDLTALGIIGTSTTGSIIVTIPPGLQAHWKLDETSGTTAADASGKGNTGTLVNGPVWSTGGGVSNALLLDGADDYVTVPDAPGLQLGRAQTIEAWINPDTYKDDWVRVVGKGNEVSKNYGIWMYPNTGRLLYQLYSADGDGILRSASALPLGQWSHVACVYDGASMNIYINGALDTQNAYTNTPYPSADPLTIGYAGSYTYYDGGIDEVKVYNKALSAEEVLASYQTAQTNTLSVYEAWLLAHYGTTNVVGSQLSSNGINTIREAYIIGINPTNRNGRFEVSGIEAPSGSMVLNWNSVSGRMYNIYWSSNILSNADTFLRLRSNIPWNVNSFTNTEHSTLKKGFYRIDVQLE